MELQALALLCALSALVCTASATQTRHALWWLAGLVSGVLLLAPGLVALPFAPLLSIDSAQLALLLALLAFACLRARVAPGLLLLSGGVLTAAWLLALRNLGYPAPAALLLGLATALASLWCGLRRPRFCTPQLQDDAWVLVLAGGLVLALVPEALQGWNSALGLKAVDAGATAARQDRSALWVAAACGCAGVLHAFFKQRYKQRISSV